MPPVKTVASPPDVDNEATAELPVLDVAAYEATLNDTINSTDSFIAPVIPTLQPAEPENLVDLSGTHEMPPLPKPNKIVKATPAPLPAAPRLVWGPWHRLRTRSPVRATIRIRVCRRGLWAARG